MILSQVILSLQLGFAIIPLIHFVSDKEKMGDYAIKKWVQIAAWLVALILVTLNGRLVLHAAIDFMKVNNWWKVAGDSRKLVQKWLPLLCDLVGSEPLGPVTDEFIGLMGSVPVRSENPVELKQVLYNEYKLEIPVMMQNGKAYIRYSINGFNSEEDLVKLESTLNDLKNRKLIF